MGRSPKYATEEERLAARKAKQVVYRATYAARQRAKRARGESTARKRWKQKKKAQKVAALAEARAAAALFTRDVPAILNSKVRTRLLIALCEHGPINVEEIGIYVARTSVPARRVEMEFLVALGMVGCYKPSEPGYRIYFLNSAHPAHSEILSFGLALARRWPSPPRPSRSVEKKAVQVPKKLPCNLFRREEGNRGLLLVAVSGGLTPMQVYRDGGFFASWNVCDDALRHFQQVGLLAREPLRSEGAGKGQPRKYFLDPNFFAFSELRNLLWALAATVYQDIVGIARALAYKHNEIEAHLADFEEATVRFSS